MNKQCRPSGIVLRQSYTSTDKLLAQRVGRYAHALPNNSCDGHTLAWSLAHTRGVLVKTIVVDKGYEGVRAT